MGALHGAQNIGALGVHDLGGQKEDKSIDLACPPLKYWEFQVNVPRTPRKPWALRHGPGGDLSCCCNDLGCGCKCSDLTLALLPHPALCAGGLDCLQLLW